MKQSRHSAAFVATVLAVLLVHLLLANQLTARMALLQQQHGAAMPPRLQAAFVRSLALAAAPPKPPALQTAPRKKPRHPAPPADAAQAPQASASLPDAAASEPASTVAATKPADAASSAQVTEIEPAASAPPPAASTPSDAAPALADAASEPGGAFAWPVSTRISYVLTGFVQGEVHGSAQVEWLREGSRYQVHIDVFVGPRFAPLMSRRMSSDGEITPQGLAPRRYDQETKLALIAARRLSMLFDALDVQLANGTRVPRPPGLQDTASQFVQLTYEFTARPHRLRAGERITLPLALPRYVANFVYEVMGEEILVTRFGDVPAFHVKPRREAVRPGDLVAEAWFAPRLQYLPVRIHITQDVESWLDLTIDQLPQQAAR